MALRARLLLLVDQYGHVHENGLLHGDDELEVHHVHDYEQLNERRGSQVGLFAATSSSQLLNVSQKFLYGLGFDRPRLHATISSFPRSF